MPAYKWQKEIIMEPTSCSIVLDTNLKAGTANVLAQKQFSRAMYKGTSNCICQLNLESGKSVHDESSWSFVSILTDQPLSVTFVDSDATIITLKCNKVLILDNTISDLIVVNNGTETATISMAKLR